MKKKKIVIITKFIYPYNSPRAMRSTELAKELARQGHDVTVYAKIGKYDYGSFEIEYNFKIKPLGVKYSMKRTSEDLEYELTTKERLMSIFFGRLFEYPDIELAYKAYKILKKESKIDTLITIANPFTIHWGTALFWKMHKKRIINTTWIADCGDPYMGNPFIYRPFYFKFVEKMFCKKTDFITIPIEEAKPAYYSEFHHKIKVIPQGFNFEEFNNEGVYKKNNIPTFIYSGLFYPNKRDPRPLLDYLINIEIDFKFTIYTKTKELVEPYKEKLGSKLILKDYIPRIELLSELSKADFLINIENHVNVQSPSKLIDYALSGRPILSINSNKNLDLEKINNFLKGNYNNALKIDNIQRYNIVNIAKQFSNLEKMN